MENVFNVKYNTKLDRLEMPKEKAAHKFLNFLDNHKFRGGTKLRGSDFDFL